jgi:hypothetical protein
MTLSINDTKHNSTAINYAEWRYAECRVYFIFMLNVIMLFHYVEFRYAECHCAEFRYSECHF